MSRNDELRKKATMYQESTLKRKEQNRLDHRYKDYVKKHYPKIDKEVVEHLDSLNKR